MQVFVSFDGVFCNLVLKSNFKIGVKDSEHKTEEQEQSQHNVNLEKNTVRSVYHVPWKHHIRKVRSSQAHKHAPK